jgi:hypothetical protein
LVSSIPSASSATAPPAPPAAIADMTEGASASERESNRIAPSANSHTFANR